MSIMTTQEPEAGPPLDATAAIDCDDPSEQVEQTSNRLFTFNQMSGQATTVIQTGRIDGNVNVALSRDPLSKLHDEVNQPILAFLANFEIYLEHVGDLQAQLDLIPQGMWPLIDTVAYGQADTFLERTGLGNIPVPAGTADVREALAFLLKVAWERGYFMAHFRRLDYIPRPAHRIDPVAILDLIIAEGDPVNPERSLGNAIEVTLQRAVSLSTEPGPVTRSLTMLGEHLVQIVQPHLDLWCGSVRIAHGYGILAARAETKICANPAS
jgi:hypothetical protein